jgi:hypothetical protein
MRIDHYATAGGPDRRFIRNDQLVNFDLLVTEELRALRRAVAGSDFPYRAYSGALR